MRTTFDVVCDVQGPLSSIHPRSYVPLLLPSILWACLSYGITYLNIPQFGILMADGVLYLISLPVLFFPRPPPLSPLSAFSDRSSLTPRPRLYLPPLSPTPTPRTP